MKRLTFLSFVVLSRLLLSGLLLHTLLFDFPIFDVCSLVLFTTLFSQSANTFLTAFYIIFFRMFIYSSSCGSLYYRKVIYFFKLLLIFHTRTAFALGNLRKRLLGRQLGFFLFKNTEQIYFLV